MEMPELLAPKLTSLLLGAMILLSPVIGLFTGCAPAAGRLACVPACGLAAPLCGLTGLRGAVPGCAPAAGCLACVPACGLAALLCAAVLLFWVLTLFPP